MTNCLIFYARKVGEVGMKVKDVMIRVHDIKKLREYLEEWAKGEITDQNRIDAIADEIDEHLSAYAEMLENKEVKWE